VELERFRLFGMRHPVRGLLHGTAAFLAIPGALLLFSRADGEPGRQLALAVYAATVWMLFTTSALYHSIPWSTRWKHRMQRVDHAMIYVLVAGTYTPVGVVVFEGWLCAGLLALVWGIAALGVAQKALLPHLRHGWGVALQTALGWLALPLIVPIARTLPAGALALAVAGGLLYTLGMVCWATQRPRLWPRVFSHHEVFHVLVVVASALHYALMLSYIALVPAI
jgi:hemolysin III